jgi:hypothetical protein
MGVKFCLILREEQKLREFQNRGRGKYLDLGSRDRSVGIALGYGLDDQGF